ncbi:MAG: Ribonuclease, Rne/Rng family, partial [Frankiales bacterium]|nr:Ribonuclease, Rne/Rng family [Frankiales bacterium]
DEQLLKALDRKVHLPSGGSLVIDRTEAMVVIDVNTGKYVGKGGNLEETVTRNNLEAAEEIARQLRLRDLGGIIVVDFIDMVLESNRDLVVRRLVECLGRDRTKHQVAEVTSLGLVQMTRKRVGQGLLESFSETCDSCGGRGVHVRLDPTGSPQGPRGTDGGAGIERVAKALKKPEPVAAEAAPAGDDDAPADDAPKRRRRGGRGRGASTVAPQDEMSELLAEPAGSEIPPAPVEDEQPAVLEPDTGSEDDTATDAVLEPETEAEVEPETDAALDVVADAPATVAADPAAGSAPVAPDVDALPDVVPELADQPTAAEEDLPVVPDLVQSVVEPEQEVRPDLVEFGHEPEAEARPRRRRRATSRPAGPAE